MGEGRSRGAQPRADAEMKWEFCSRGPVAAAAGERLGGARPRPGASGGLVRCPGVGGPAKGEAAQAVVLLHVCSHVFICATPI